MNTGLVNDLFQDIIDCRLILFISDCGLIIQGPPAAKADSLPGPGPEPGTVFDLNSDDEKIDMRPQTCLL